jgi:hypothetical protein
LKIGGLNLKALTIKQPWASLIALGEKKIETRSWKTNYRGPILIHAGKQVNNWICHQDPYLKVLNKHNIILSSDLPKGELIAKSNLVDCVKMVRLELDDEGKDMISILENGKVVLDNELKFGDYSTGRYAWILEDIKQIKPISVKGQLSLWNYNLEGE